MSDDLSNEIRPDHHACDEYNQLSRRNFLATGGAAAAALSFPAWMPRIVLAQNQASDRDIVVSIFLTGGCDGMAFVIPFGDPEYYAPTFRPNLSIGRPDQTSDPNRALALDNFFGLSPALASLMPAYRANDLLVVHATGSVNNNRSHFEAQKYMEVGKPADPRIIDGWLGRHLRSIPPLKPDAPLRAMGYMGGLPQTLVGGTKTLPIPNPAAFTIGGSAGTAAERGNWLARDYAPSGGNPMAWQAHALDATSTIGLLQGIAFGANYRPQNGTTYPTSGFGQQMRNTAALIRSEVGVEAVHLTYGGWDTHVEQQSRFPGGGMYNRMRDVADSLGAFWQDLMSGGVTQRVTLLIVSEFGRNARENGSAGTDHGRGNVMWAMGKGINGGRVLSQWPGLSRDVLESGQDLRVTIDHRDVLAEIVRNRLKNPNISAIFPDFTPRTQSYNVTRV
jgi:uncharacterized protein (DUF1501 family)